MLTPFTIKLNPDFFDNKYRSIALSDYESYKNKSRAALESMTIDGIIDGAKINQSWFPDITKDIFTSHSHKDEDLAIRLAGWVKEETGLTCFVDSCVWGHAGDLLRDLDDKYALIKTESGKNNYSRDAIISHCQYVHMLLITALSKVIANSRFLFFLDTGHSVKVSVTGSDKPVTYSPWIFAEAFIGQIISNASKYLREANENYRGAATIELPIDIKDFCVLNENSLLSWKKEVLYGKNANQSLLRISRK